MKKLYLLLFLLTASMFGSTYQCEIFQIKNLETNITTDIYNNTSKVFIVKKDKTVKIIMPGINQTFTYSHDDTTVDGRKIEFYENKESLIVIYKNFSAGIRLIYDNTLTDIVNCIKVDENTSV